MSSLPALRAATVGAVALHRRALACAALAIAVAAAPGAHAAEPGPDPSVIVARTVYPRIAYRALPVQDNPVRTEATTFPGRVFHATLDRSLAPLLDDAALGQHGSGGIGVAAAAGAVTGLLVPSAGVGAGNAFGGPAASAPLGASASVGGAVIGATAGLGDTISGAVMQAAMPSAVAPPPTGSGR
ncbi:hypothetical protein [Lysobacter enzymogenes]|uniref:hypothetical protein n=1 Tax=Lysobacter enzymogenes TaxID=69 RepID=UPI001A972CD7|nr:hypothetical protein [Lysobacter enzymogenes]QQP94823.1 hypothetical protein JHW38_16420 [Lysobacter enzymogenes]